MAGQEFVSPYPPVTHHPTYLPNHLSSPLFGLLIAAWTHRAIFHRLITCTVVHRRTRYTVERKFVHYTGCCCLTYLRLELCQSTTFHTGTVYAVEGRACRTRIGCNSNYEIILLNGSPTISKYSGIQTRYFAGGGLRIVGTEVRRRRGGE